MAWLATTTAADTEASWRRTSSISWAMAIACSRSSGDRASSGSSPETKSAEGDPGEPASSRSTRCSPSGVHSDMPAPNPVVGSDLLVAYATLDGTAVPRRRWLWGALTVFAALRVLVVLGLKPARFGD